MNDRADVSYIDVCELERAVTEVAEFTLMHNCRVRAYQPDGCLLLTSHDGGSSYLSALNISCHTPFHFEEGILNSNGATQWLPLTEIVRVLEGGESRVTELMLVPLEQLPAVAAGDLDGNALAVLLRVVLCIGCGPDMRHTYGLQCRCCSAPCCSADCVAIHAAVCLIDVFTANEGLHEQSAWCDSHAEQSPGCAVMNDSLLHQVSATRVDTSPFALAFDVSCRCSRNVPRAWPMRM